MTEIQKYILELTKSALFNKIPKNPPNDLDWEALYELAVAQNITGFLATAVLKLPEDKEPPNKVKWKKSIAKTGYIMYLKFNEFERILKILNQNNICPLCLKGIVVKDLYPSPELRTMGDFDIWIDKKDREKAENIFKNEGYTIKRDVLFTDLEKGNAHGELFISLEDDFRTEPEYWNKVLWENKYKNNDRYLLTADYELAYSVIHAAKHITREGCGIRNLLDVVLLIKNRENINIQNVIEICKAQAFENVLYYMINAAKEIYSVEIDDFDYSNISKEKTYKFVEYMLSYGIFGNQHNDNVLAKQVTYREGQNTSAFRRIFFPPKEMIWHKYRYLKKYPFLLPFAWVHRFFTAVFVKKYKVTTMVKNVNESLEYSKEHDKLLEDLDLKN